MKQINTPLFPDSQSPSSKKTPEHAPLSYLLSPKCLNDYVGQAHIMAPGKPLRIWIETDAFSSLILYGPPGVGKTALARLIARQTKALFIPLNAVFSKIQDLRNAIEQAKNAVPKKTVLFIDEIHRFNKGQQDALLPDLEKGLITLIGATTENPFFAINNSILSRVTLFELFALGHTDLKTILETAIAHPKLKQLHHLKNTTKMKIIRQAQGDARQLINILEALSKTSKESTELTEKDLSALKKTGIPHAEDTHYDLSSAFIKSIRGSDTNASLYWLARLIKGGEDPRFIARRLLILASEDIGNADPHALVLASATLNTVKQIGMPESKYALSQTTIYLSKAEKCNAALRGINNALDYIDQGHLHPVPNHLRDAHHPALKKQGRGSGYLYPHHYPNNTVEQCYWPGKKDFLGKTQA